MQRQARRKKSRCFYKKVPTFFQKCRDFLFHVCFLRSGRVGYLWIAESSSCRSNTAIRNSIMGECRHWHTLHRHELRRIWIKCTLKSADLCKICTFHGAYLHEKCTLHGANIVFLLAKDSSSFCHEPPSSFACASRLASLSAFVERSVGDRQTIFGRSPTDCQAVAKRLRDICQATSSVQFYNLRYCFSPKR